MNIKLRARLAGIMDSAEWTKEMEAYKSILEREERNPLPSDQLLTFVKELTDREQQAMAYTLEFPFAKRDSKRWPNMLFMKMLRTCMLQAHKDIAVKRRLLLSILQYSPLTANFEEERLNTLIHKLDEHITQSGFWAVYWALYFHPDKDLYDELWKNEIQKLLTKRDEIPLIPSVPMVQLDASLHSIAAENDKQSKKFQLLESRYGKEVSQRQKLEQDNARKDKLLRMKGQELERIVQELSREKQEAAQAAARYEELQLSIQQRVQQWKKEQDRWLAERQDLFKNIHAANTRHKQLEQGIDAKQKELAALIKEKEQLQHTIAQLKKQQHDPIELANGLVQTLYREIGGLNQALLQRSASADCSGINAKTTRQQIRKALDLADALEEYLPAEQPSEAISSLASIEETGATSIHTALVGPAPQSVSLSLADSLHHEIAPQPAPAFYGTFYRRDHGGYVVLETGETFNITESLVYQHQLEHEAEVLCTPNNQSGRPHLYDLRLVFQGDDTYSPVQQFDGYVELGEHHMWYCIDMNDASSRFQIHHKDIEIQKPSHGVPCTFNVAEGGHIARLTRIYHLNGQASTEEKAGDSNSEKEHPHKRINRNKSNANLPKQKPEPFLQGCTITIIGGLRKWFEDVVTEAGAELVHETGDHPERMTAELRRSQALFMLLTSTSHRATWEGIEVAKAYGIPHFIIQGSKSNLRKLLWDNRELILSSNRALQQ